MKDENINEKTSNPAPKDEKPLVTFALFTYNQERYIAEAIQGALSQTYSPLEIIISDDCSTDRTWEIVRREVANYTGPHKVVLNRNKANLGIGAHVNKVNDLAQGELIVAAAGDDVSLPQRVSALVRAYKAVNQKHAVIFSAFFVIDENGFPTDKFRLPPVLPEHLTAEWLAAGMRGVFGCTSSWTKNLFTIFGPLDTKVIHEDAVLPFRAALAGKVVYVNEALVKYRRHGANIWKNACDIQTVKDLMGNINTHARGNLQVMETKIADLRRYELSTLSLTATHSTEVIRATLYSYRSAYETELLLAEAATLLERAGILAKALLRGIPIRTIARWVLIFITPSIYLLLRRVKYQK